MILPWNWNDYTIFIGFIGLSHPYLWLKNTTTTTNWIRLLPKFVSNRKASLLWYFFSRFTLTLSANNSQQNLFYPCFFSLSLWKFSHWIILNLLIPHIFTVKPLDYIYKTRSFESEPFTLNFSMAFFAIFVFLLCIAVI